MVWNVLSFHLVWIYLISFRTRLQFSAECDTGYLLLTKETSTGMRNAVKCSAKRYLNNSYMFIYVMCFATNANE